MRKLFTNGLFYLMNDSNDIAKAIITENGKIEEIYYDKIPIAPDIILIDLEGAFVYPGFIDTHTHSFEGGLYSQSLNLNEVKSLNETLELINDYYIKCKHDGRNHIDAFRFDETKVIERRFPINKELDSVAPDIPLVLRRIDGHSSVVNSLAWDRFYAANQTIADKDSQSESSDNNVLRGDLNDKLVHWFQLNCSDQDILRAYQFASELALANGITTIHTMVGDSHNSIMHYRLLRDNLKHFKADFILYPQSFNITAALDVGATRIGGCILADGSLGSYTAALTEPYSNNPGSCGKLYHKDDFWKRFINEAVKHNLQVAVHCIGDKAIKQINDIYLSVSQNSSIDLRHQLIHCELTPDALLKEITESKAIPVMQPSFDLYWGGKKGLYHEVLGLDRARYMNRFKSFIQNGVKITGGSDWYITELDALQGINAAINHTNTLEALSPFDALKMYTVDAAYLSHDECRIGKLDLGYDADFVCLDTDIMITENTHSKTKVLSTYKNGNLVYIA